MASTEYKEYVLTIDAFNKPTTVNGIDAIGLMLTRIIVLEPGTNPLHPTMGVGLVSKYRFVTDKTVEANLIDDINKQIDMFLPHLSGAEIELEYQSDNTIDIKLRIDDVMFVYDSSAILPITLSTIASN